MEMPRISWSKTSRPNAWKTPHICIVKSVAQRGAPPGRKHSAKSMIYKQLCPLRYNRQVWVALAEQ